MRVIAGKARRTNLETIPGLDTRPTTDRIKETLFNMIQNSLIDCVFLDLFAGSGAIGIEALSRGAAQAVFVEQNAEAVKCIRKNLEKTHLVEQASVRQADVLAEINHLKSKRCSFDIIFMDPPYRIELEKAVLYQLADSDLIHADTLIIVEASIETDFSYVSELGFSIEKEKQYKTNKHVFLKKDK